MRAGSISIRPIRTGSTGRATSRAAWDSSRSCRSNGGDRQNVGAQNTKSRPRVCETGSCADYLCGSVANQHTLAHNTNVGHVNLAVDVVAVAGCDRLGNRQAHADHTVAVGVAGGPGVGVAADPTLA